MKTTPRPLPLFAIFLFIPLLPAFAQLPQPGDPLPLYADVKIGKLPNGLTYYIRTNKTIGQYADLRLLVRAGSLQEDDRQQGLAHLITHMAFDGTKHFIKEELGTLLKAIGEEGEKFGADQSVRAGFDETVFKLPVRMKNTGDLEKGMTLLEDWASGISFGDNDITGERAVVLDELRTGKEWQFRPYKPTLAKLYENSRYAVRLPAGNEEVLKSFTADDVRRYYRDWYRPDLMAIVVFGDVDPAEAERLITLHFAGLKNPSKEIARIDYPITPRIKSDAVKRVATDKTSILQIFQGLAKSRNVITLADLRNATVKKMFETMLTSRFTENIQKPDAPFFLANAKVVELDGGYETFCSQAYFKDAIEPAIIALTAETERARISGFSASELDVARKSLLAFSESEFIHQTSLRRLADDLAGHFLAGNPILDVRKKIDYTKTLLSDIKLEEINQYTAQTIPSAGPKLIAVSAPEQKDFVLPAPQQLVAMVENPKSIEIKKPVEKGLIAVPPAPGKILSNREVAEGGYTELKFDNGITVLLKPVASGKKRVMMNGFRSGGQSLFDPKDQYNAQLLAQAIPAMGAGDLSAPELQKILAAKQSFAFPRIDPVTDGMTGLSETGDIETMLQVSYLFFTQPRRDEEAFNNFLNSKAESLKKPLDTETRFQDSVWRIVYHNHPLAPQMPTQKTIERFTLDRMFPLYKARYGNAAGYTFIITGPFDSHAAIPLAATYLGSLPASGPAATAKDYGLRPVKGVLRKQIRMGNEENSVVSMRFTGEAPYSPEEQLRLRALEDILSARLRDVTANESDGLFGNLSKYPYEHYDLQSGLRCTPENVDQRIKTVLGELEKIKTSGPTAEELAQARAEWKERHEKSLKNPERWIRELQAALETKTTLDTWLNYNKYADALTPDDIKATANKYLGMKNYVQVTLYPENK